MGRTTTVASSSQDYLDLLRGLSEASTTGPHFEAFKDIAWDSPEYDVTRRDVVWAMPDLDPITGSRWYQDLSVEQRTAVSRHRLASFTKTGSQFEQLLLLGGTQFLMRQKNGNPEFRYFMHELTEECHHIQMMQEFTNRVAPQIHGCPTWLLRLFPFVAFLGTLWPSLFFLIILAGEEPIDHVQKSILRTGRVHPLLDRIMQIHVAEEARHIGFAHAWLEHHGPGMGRFTRFVAGLLTPVIMRIGFHAIMVPSRQDRKMMGIPRATFRECYGWRSPELRQLFRNCCADVRQLADANGLRTGTTSWAWKAVGADGRASRFRSEPPRAA